MRLHDITRAALTTVKGMIQTPSWHVQSEMHIRSSPVDIANVREVFVHALQIVRAWA